MSTSHDGDRPVAARAFAQGRIGERADLSGATGKAREMLVVVNELLETAAMPAATFKPAAGASRGRA